MKFHPQNWPLQPSPVEVDLSRAKFGDLFATSDGFQAVFVQRQRNDRLGVVYYMAILKNGTTVGHGGAVHKPELFGFSAQGRIVNKKVSPDNYCTIVGPWETHRGAFYEFASSKIGDRMRTRSGALAVFLGRDRTAEPIKELHWYDFYVCAIVPPQQIHSDHPDAAPPRIVSCDEYGSTDPSAFSPDDIVGYWIDPPADQD